MSSKNLNNIDLQTSIDRLTDIVNTFQQTCVTKFADLQHRITEINNKLEQMVVSSLRTPNKKPTGSASKPTKASNAITWFGNCWAEDRAGMIQQYDLRNRGIIPALDKHMTGNPNLTPEQIAREEASFIWTNYVTGENAPLHQAVKQNYNAYKQSFAEAPAPNTSSPPNTPPVTPRSTNRRGGHQPANRSATARPSDSRRTANPRICDEEEITAENDNY